MRKKPVFLFLFLTCIISCFTCYCQDKSRYKCTYQFDFLNDTISMDYFRQEIYIVQIGENLTKGFTYQKFFLDSLEKASPVLYRQMYSETLNKGMEAMTRTGDIKHMSHSSIHYGAFQSDLFKDYKKNEIRVRDNISINNFIYNDELKAQDWELLSDTDTILGYYCQKAQCSWRGRDWEAWFTSEIPISEGPWKFYGLPGLITKLHDTKKHYSFELIGFQEIKELIDTKIPKGTQKMERKEFLGMAFGKKGELITEADMAKVGLSNSEPLKFRYDYIERDY